VLSAFALLLVLLTVSCGGDSEPPQTTVSEYGATSAPQAEIDDNPSSGDMLLSVLGLILKAIANAAELLAAILFELICSIAVWWVSFVVGIVVFGIVPYYRTKDGGWRYADWRHEAFLAVVFALLSTLIMLLVSLFCWILG
jgi:hypothetical protein